MRKSKFVILLLLIVFSLNAQKVIDSSSKKRPIWLKETPNGKLFNYFSGISSSKKSLDEAKNLAISDVLSEIIMQNEITVEGEVTTFEEDSELELISRITKEIKLKGSSTSVKGLEKEEEYWETIQTQTDILYRYWILMKIPQRQYTNYSFSPDELNQTYGAVPIIKSSLIPGWGQIQKKETTKGIIFLSGFAVTLTSAIITNSVSKSYEQDAKKANGADWITYYNDLSDQYYLLSMASFVLSGAIYGYNVFDVISSKGAKIYAFNEKNTLQIAFDLKSTKSMLELSIKF
jgi:hypothetical protein